MQRSSEEKTDYLKDLSKLTSTSEVQVKNEEKELLDKFIDYLINHIEDENLDIAKLIINAAKQGKYTCQLTISDIKDAKPSFDEECCCNPLDPIGYIYNRWFLSNDIKEFRRIMKLGFEDKTGYCINILNKHFQSKGLTFAYGFETYTITWNRDLLNT